jgi:hypothetical protein
VARHYWRQQEQQGFTVLGDRDPPSNNYRVTSFVEALVAWFLWVLVGVDAGRSLVVRCIESRY